MRWSPATGCEHTEKTRAVGRMGNGCAGASGTMKDRGTSIIFVHTIFWRSKTAPNMQPSNRSKPNHRIAPNLALKPSTRTGLDSLHYGAECRPRLGASGPACLNHVGQVGGGVDGDVRPELVEHHADEDVPRAGHACPGKISREHLPDDDAEAVDVAGVGASGGPKHLESFWQITVRTEVIKHTEYGGQPRGPFQRKNSTRQLQELAPGAGTALHGTRSLSEPQNKDGDILNTAPRRSPSIYMLANMSPPQHVARAKMRSKFLVSAVEPVPQARSKRCSSGCSCWNWLRT